MGSITIEGLPSTVIPTKDHLVPAMRDGETVKLSVSQIIGLLGEEELAPIISAVLEDASADDSIDDSDNFIYMTGSEVKAASASGLISSIFKTTRKIANANFDTSLRLWDTTDNSKGLSFDLTGIATGQTRKVKAPDRDVDLNDVSRGIGIGQTWQDVSASRVASTVYQNTTGKAIMVALRGRSTASSSRDFQVADNAAFTVNVVALGMFDQSSAPVTNLSAIVPDGKYYRVDGASTITIWAELR